MTPVDEARALLAEALGMQDGELTEAASMETLDAWDSLAHLRLILRLEERLGRELAADEILEVTSLASVAAFLDRVATT